MLVLKETRIPKWKRSDDSSTDQRQKEFTVPSGTEPKQQQSFLWAVSVIPFPLADSEATAGSTLDRGYLLMTSSDREEDGGYTRGTEGSRRNEIEEEEEEWGEGRTKRQGAGECQCQCQCLVQVVRRRRGSSKSQSISRAWYQQSQTRTGAWAGSI